MGAQKERVKQSAEFGTDQVGKEEILRQEGNERMAWREGINEWRVCLRVGQGWGWWGGWESLKEVRHWPFLCVAEVYCPE